MPSLRAAPRATPSTHNRELVVAASIASVDGFVPNTLELSGRARNEIDNKDITDLVCRVDIVSDGPVCIA